MKIFYNKMEFDELMHLFLLSKFRMNVCCKKGLIAFKELYLGVNVKWGKLLLNEIVVGLAITADL